MKIPVSSKGEGGDYKKIEAGTYFARVLKIIDMGTQVGTYGAKRQFRFTFETPTETAVFKEENGEQPFLVDYPYITLTLTTSDAQRQSKLTEIVKACLGNLPDDELYNIDLKDLLGKPCMITVETKEKDGKTYPKVKTVTGVMKGFDVENPEMQLVNSTVYFSLELNEYDPRLFEELPEWMQKEIKKSTEYKLAADKLTIEEIEMGKTKPVDPSLDEVPF